MIKKFTTVQEILAQSGLNFVFSRTHPFIPENNRNAIALSCFENPWRIGFEDSRGAFDFASMLNRNAVTFNERGFVETGHALEGGFRYDRVTMTLGGNVFFKPEGRLFSHDQNASALLPQIRSGLQDFFITAHRLKREPELLAKTYDFIAESGCHFLFWPDNTMYERFVIIFSQDIDATINELKTAIEERGPSFAEVVEKYFPLT